MGSGGDSIFNSRSGILEGELRLVKNPTSFRGLEFCSTVSSLFIRCTGNNTERTHASGEVWHGWLFSVGILREYDVPIGE